MESSFPYEPSTMISDDHSFQVFSVEYFLLWTEIQNNKQKHSHPKRMILKFLKTKL